MWQSTKTKENNEEVSSGKSILYIISCVIAAVFSITMMYYDWRSYYTEDEKMLLKIVKGINPAGDLKGFEITLDQALKKENISERIRKEGRVVSWKIGKVLDAKQVAINNSGSMGFGGAFVVGGMIGEAKQDLIKSIKDFKNVMYDEEQQRHPW